MDRLKQLVSLCKCSVSITVNDHRDMYQSVTKALEDQDDLDNFNPADLDVEDARIRARMIETDTMVRLQFYPDTPIGFYTIWHYDIDGALDQALDILKGNTP
jgi:hypothetical protein